MKTRHAPRSALLQSIAQPATVRLFSRQRLLLRLLEAVGGTVGATDFQKLLFLYCQDPATGQPYEFVPYRFGAFSFTSYADRRKLVHLGLLCDEDSWTLTAVGRTLARNDKPDPGMHAFALRLSHQRGDTLVAETYRQYPYYATRSEIAEQILGDDEAARGRIEVARPPQRTATLYTIGYEGQSLERYLNALIRSGTTVLCDVRRNPLSRKYGFSKTTLSRACEGVGIRYEHVPELGIASEQRRELDSQESYDALFAAYENDYLPGQAESLGKIQRWLADGECVALTCYEHLPHQCHRHCVAEGLTALTSGAIVAQHL